MSEKEEKEAQTAKTSMEVIEKGNGHPLRSKEQYLTLRRGFAVYSPMGGLAGLGKTPVEYLIDEGYANVKRKQSLPRFLQRMGLEVSQVTDAVNLRALASSVWVQRCINIIQNEVLSHSFEIVPVNPQDDSPQTTSLIEEINDFLTRINANGESFKDVLRKAIHDFLVLDQAVLVKNFDPRAYRKLPLDTGYQEEFLERLDENDYFTLTYVPMTAPKGLLREVMAVDGGSFVKQPDIHGVILGYWQLSPRTGRIEFFSKREVIWLSANTTTYSLYGWSPLQSVKQVVESLVATVYNAKKFHEEGDIPQGILAILGSEDQYDRFKEYWETEVAGKPYKFPVVGVSEEGDVKFIPLTFSKQDIMFLDEMDFFQRLVMSAFLITPSELGLTDSVNRATGYEQKHVMRRAVIKPLLKLIEELVNQHIISEFDEDGRVKFQWIIEEEAEEELRKQSIVSQQLRAGLRTINEVRTEMGLDPVPWGDAPFDLNIWLQNAILIDPTLFGLPEIDYESLLGGRFEEPPQEPQEPQEGEEKPPSDETDTEGEEADPDEPNASDKKSMVFAKKRIEEWLLSPKIGGMGDPLKKTIQLLRHRFPHWSYSKLVFHAQKLLDEGLKVKDIEEATSLEELLAKQYRPVTHPKPEKKSLKQKAPIKLVSKAMIDRERLMRLSLRGLKTLTEKLRVAIRKVVRGARQNEAVIMKIVNKYAGLSEDQALQTLSKDPDIEQVVQAIQQGVLEETHRHLQTALQYGANLVYDTQGRPVVQQLPQQFEVIDSEAIALIKTRGLLISDTIASDIEKKLKYAILEGLRAGDGIPQLAQRITQQIDIDNYGASRIARTEVMYASNYSKHKILKKAGFKKFVFLAYRDERICEKCEPFHGKKFDLNDAEHMPPIHPNCRCTILADSEEVGVELPSDEEYPIPEPAVLETVVQAYELGVELTLKNDKWSEELFMAGAELYKEALRLKDMDTRKVMVRLLKDYLELRRKWRKMTKQ